MATEMGEYLVGAWLREIAGCDIVDYNLRPPVGGSAGQAEFDVLGLDFRDGTAHLCEVATHLGGLNYGAGYRDTADRLAKKHARQRDYATRYLGGFACHRFTLWSPRVPVGRLTDALAGIDGLELVINDEFSRRVAELNTKAGTTTRGTGNPFYRALQILAHLRK